MKKYEDLCTRLSCLVVFKNVLKNDEVAAFLKLLKTPDDSPEEIMKNHAEFVSLLLGYGEDLSEFFADIIKKDENVYIKKLAGGREISKSLQTELENELSLFNQIIRIKSEDILKDVGDSGFLMPWENFERDLKKEYLSFAKEAHIKGYGIYNGNTMFYFDGKDIKLVKSPDPIRLSQLSGYREARKRVEENTLALVNGKVAANVLLYGDAGTGKSSTVKALINEYAEKGLRLVEVGKQRLMDIPMLMESLAGNPLKFIVFIDDLSFDQSTDEFGALKAILEGSAGMRPKNVAVYATGNRRQIVRQSFKDRFGDDVHAEETMQDQMALAERFGLSVGFFRPDKDQYLKIVWDLAGQYGLKNTENLELLAERFALERGGRSGRVARQLVEYLSIME
ncbi:MAG TPA: ATP-binding protein [Clostridiales bacterium]|nr:ATP-binding protein [Clostridiales bacterium]HRT81776.1 ATP-binding protein [Oscillospiraceae bacterium]